MSMTSYLEEHSPEAIRSVEMKDEEILYASQEEPAMFQILVEKYQEPLTRAALRVVRGREEAEDIVQEAFVKMYKNAGKFQKLAGIEFKSWAYKITVNTAITHYRKLKRGEILSEDPAVFQEAGDDFLGERFSLVADAKAAVADTLTKMPGHLRSVMHRYYMEDKSYRTIAQEEQISVSTLKMRLFRAKKIFRKLINTSDTSHSIDREKNHD
ncbi:MAG: RNA polymerase sigma factor [Candidatus Sungbacteria bacterium]|uniref:RNA polymerase sigma factor n=1 Tax=Candidatus Sungiibacteriota bacterium TaxID=2750080 RepID=A0A932VQY2_9BACT|nr:RNA polymerase sigma factor [Candidatus Sungbacteria bacterium]